PGEKISLFFDTTEAKYISRNIVADSKYQFHGYIRMPWISDGVYHIKAVGDRGTVALADTTLLTTRTIDYECEDLIPEIAEEFTEPSYLGYYTGGHWSNQYT